MKPVGDKYYIIVDSILRGHGYSSLYEAKQDSLKMFTQANSLSGPSEVLVVSVHCVTEVLGPTVVDLVRSGTVAQ